MSLDVTGTYRYPSPDAAWLNKHIEDAVEPGLPIIDPHHHIWEQDGRPYFLEDLSRDIAGGHNVRATVLVEAHFRYRNDGPERLKPVGETEAVMAFLEKSDAAIDGGLCAGIVAHADLKLGANVSEVIDAHRSIAGNRLKGVRQSVARDEHFPNGIVIRPAPRGLLADSNYRQGLERLQEHGLSYDAMLYHAQIPELTDMAAALPELPIVLDHYGCILGVGIYEDRAMQTFNEWRRDLKQLAERQNVSIKLGGLGMIVCGAKYHLRTKPPGSEELAADWARYIETCIEFFGPGRCMFESNFPVDKAMYSYTVLWNAFKRVSAQYTADERASLFSETARRFYRL